MIVGAHDWTASWQRTARSSRWCRRPATKRPFPAYALNAFTSARRSRSSTACRSPSRSRRSCRTRSSPRSRTAGPTPGIGALHKKKGGGGGRDRSPAGLGRRRIPHVPHFSGLCGYVFGKNATGRLNPKNVGVENKEFIKNAGLIDRWNKARPDQLEASRSSISQDLVPQGQGRVLVHRAPGTSTPSRRSASSSSSSDPEDQARAKAVPFLGVQGLMVTKYAAWHGVGAVAKDFVSNYMAGAGPQARGSHSPKAGSLPT